MNKFNIFQKILRNFSWFFFVMSYNGEDFNDDIFNGLVENFMEKYPYKSILKQNFHNYFNKIYDKFQKEKVIGSYSYNMKFISDFLLKSSNLYKQLDCLSSIQFEDKFFLYYMFNKQKYVNIIVYSKKKEEFMDQINNSLNQYVIKELQKNIIKINNKDFNIINIGNNIKSNENFLNIYNTYLGQENCSIAITLMESMIIKESYNSNFLVKNDKILKKIDLFLYSLLKIQELFNKNIFFNIKQLILKKFTKKKFLPFNINYGENIHHYLFNLEKKDLENSIKKTMFKDFISRNLLIEIYHYLY
jgi:hypothetical protein